MVDPTDKSSSGSKNESVINIDDPLYVHPSDNVVTSVINFKLLRTENYRFWRSSMIRAFKARNKLGFTNGTISKHSNDPITLSKWELANVVTHSWILGSISENIYTNHACSESVLKIWVELFEAYHKDDGSVISNVHQKINSFTQGSLFLSDYVNKLESYWKEFDFNKAY